MAYDANGKWVQEDDSVGKKMTGLLAQDSDYMATATTAGKAAANARGLQNSSIGIGAVENERIRAALPIAAQEAQQGYGKNLQAQGHVETGVLQGRQIASTEKVAAQELQAAQARQRAEIKARADEGEKARLLQLQLQGNDLTAQDKARLETIASNEKIASENRTSDERQQTTVASNQIAAMYQDAYNALMANKDMPADQRNIAMQQIAKQRDSQMALLESLYQVDLPWPS